MLSINNAPQKIPNDSNNEKQIGALRQLRGTFGAMPTLPVVAD